MLIYSKTAEDMNFKFGRRVLRDSPDMTPDKSFRYVGVSRSRDRDNSTVQTATMGQIPRSTERILVNFIFIFFNLLSIISRT